MENIQFTDEEIKEQLEALGYFNVSQERIQQFKKGNCFLIFYELLFKLKQNYLLY